MSRTELEQKVARLRELRAMEAEIAKEIEAVQDEIKHYMEEKETDELYGHGFKITWKAIKSSRLDTSAIRNALPEVMQAFTKESIAKRFCITSY